MDISSPLEHFLYEEISCLSCGELDCGCGINQFFRFCEQRGLEVFESMRLHVTIKTGTKETNG